MKTQQEKFAELKDYLIERNISFDDSQISQWQGREVKIRNVSQTGKRAILLYFYNLHLSIPLFSKGMLIELVQEENLTEALSPNEQDWLSSADELSEQRRKDISWNSEGLYVMLWALNKIENFELPLEPCSTEEISSRMPEPPVDQWLGDLSYRDNSEIAFQADLIYNLHWAVRDAGLKGIEVPNLHPRIVYERHFAFSWMLDQRDSNWDDISTDT